MGGMAGLAALGSFATACGTGSGTPAAAPPAGTPTAGQQATRTQPPGPGPSTTPSGVDEELLAHRYGLRPFAPAPAPPAVKPVTLRDWKSVV